MIFLITIIFSLYSIILWVIAYSLGEKSQKNYLEKELDIYKRGRKQYLEFWQKSLHDWSELYEELKKEEQKNADVKRYCGF